MNVFTADLALVITRLALLLGLGWFLARQGWVVAASRQSLMRLVIWVFFPAMIFDRVCGNPLINSGTTALLYLGVGFGMIVAGILVGRLVAQALALPGDVCRRTFAFASGTNNFGYLGIPITAALFDRDVVGVLLVHNVGVEAAIWTVGLLVLSGQSLRDGWRKLLSPVFITLVVAVGCNLAGVYAHLPKVLLDAVHALALCGIPLGLVMTGVSLAGHLSSPRELFDARVSLAAGALRLGVLPLLIIGLALVLPCSKELKHVLVVQAAMPSAMVPVILARLYGGHPRTAVQIVVGTTAVGILTIPLWLRAGLSWVGP